MTSATRADVRPAETVQRRRLGWTFLAAAGVWVAYIVLVITVSAAALVLAGRRPGDEPGVA